MKMKDIASNLCYYDKRNPDNNLDVMDLDDNEIESARIDCRCDNCFYGRTKLAEYIIKLSEILGNMSATNDTENIFEEVVERKFKIKK